MTRGEGILENKGKGGEEESRKEREGGEGRERKERKRGKREHTLGVGTNAFLPCSPNTS